MNWIPIRGEAVRVGPVTVPSHEWVGEFVRWAVNPRFCVVRHPIWGEQNVRVECLRGPADE